MERLTSTIQNYAWGSHTLLASLRGDSSSDLPEAEIWYGAHPQAPSTMPDGRTLLEHIDENPVELLGPDAIARFGPKLPFLLKLLAADRPLSIQAHPSMAQAQEGFAREQDQGIAKDAIDRSFRDDNHKPELIAAITPFEGLVGFRPLDESLMLLSALDSPEWLLSLLESSGPVGVLQRALDPHSDAERSQVAEAVRSVVDGAKRYSGTKWARAADLLCRLDAHYPNDPGIAVAALLNHIVLDPDDGIYLGAGNLHAYVGGLGVEAMANSDNVVRGGLTPKHIDVAALLDIVRADEFDAVPISIIDNRYVSPAPEFALTRVDPREARRATGPAIVVGVRKSTSLASASAGSENNISLEPTEAAWIPYGETAVATTSGLAFVVELGSEI